MLLHWRLLLFLQIVRKLRAFGTCFSSLLTGSWYQLRSLSGWGETQQVTHASSFPGMAVIFWQFAKKWRVVNLAVVAAASPGEVQWLQRARGGPCCWAWPPTARRANLSSWMLLLPVIAIRVFKTVTQLKNTGICFPSWKEACCMNYGRRTLSTQPIPRTQYRHYI